MNMVHHPYMLALHTLAAISLLSTTSANSILAQNPKLSLRLIHRHSISSPSSKPKILSPSLTDDYRTPVMPMDDGSLFLVNISIGEPPVPQLLAMDTGSHLIWVRCTLCGGCSYNTFNPQNSSTYSQLSSYSPQCTGYVYGFQEHQSRCSFDVRYQDRSTSRGLLALEKFTFLTSSGGTVQVPDVVFGCAADAAGGAADLNGVLGLEAVSEYSFVARTGGRFSYCIGSIRDTHYAHNQLIFGDGAVMEGDSTPMQIKGGHYVVSLEGISVGEKALEIDRGQFRYNVVIDSGTTVSKLRRSAYEALAAEVREIIGGVLEPAEVRNAEGQICYKGDLERDLKGFPIVRLQLGEGAELEVDVEGLFMRSSDGTAFCMAVVEANENLIGVLAQQYYNVGFDLEAKRVSFQRIECELLED